MAKVTLRYESRRQSPSGGKKSPEHGTLNSGGTLDHTPARRARAEQPPPAQAGAGPGGRGRGRVRNGPNSERISHMHLAVHVDDRWLMGMGRARRVCPAARYNIHNGQKNIKYMIYIF